MAVSGRTIQGNILGGELLRHLVMWRNTRKCVVGGVDKDCVDCEYTVDKYYF